MNLALKIDIQTILLRRAYQTPIYTLLQANLILTLDFIIDLINYSSKKYTESRLDEGQVETIVLFLDDGEKTDLPIFRSTLVYVSRNAGKP